MNTQRNTLSPQAGSSMMEVLVSLIILMVGLLGLAGLMVQSQRSEMESYQRVQALVLLQDMVGRINANRSVASCYNITTDVAAGRPYLGIGSTILPVLACTAGTSVQNARAVEDMKAWNRLLWGATEIKGNSNAGAMVGARGCVSYNSTAIPAAGGPLLDTKGVALPGTGVYTVEVAWQGNSETFASPGLFCGKNLYGAESKRRVVSLTFRIASINNVL